MKLPEFKHPDFTEERFVKSPDARTAKVFRDGVAPENYHATSMYPEYYKINGKWILAEGSRMDCVPVLCPDGTIDVKEFRRLTEGESVIIGRTDDGSEGIYLYSGGFAAEANKIDTFAFRSGRTRETSFHNDYKKLKDLLKHDKDEGHIVWVLGPAAVFDAGSRKAMEYMVNNGYCHAVFGGNAVATHDIEASMFNTALGQDICTDENKPNGHYNHLDAINKVTELGSIEAAVEAGIITNGLVHACVKNEVPMVLAGSLRDDGPLPEVNCNTCNVQDDMRMHTKKATTIICLATQLHTIATGNLTPSYVKVDGKIRPVYIYAVDVSEFVLNKLRDRGTLEVTTIVANIQDFLFKLTNLLKEEE